MSKNRATVFVFYDKDGIVDRYVLYLIKGILEFSEKLVIVCNGKITDEGKKELGKLTDDILVRENRGFDAWGYKAGIECIGWDKLNLYDELILMNDSVFGPVDPFKYMFEKMDEQNLGFWGITKHEQTPNPFGLTDDEVFPEHIQSYFISIGREMFSNTEFKEYWDKMREIDTLEETISFFEVQFTKHFAEQGFSWDVFVDPNKIGRASCRERV